MVSIKELDKLEPISEEEAEQAENADIVRPKVLSWSTEARCLDLVFEATVRFLEEHPDDKKAKYYKAALRIIAAEMKYA